MAEEFVEVVDITFQDVTIASATNSTLLYGYTVPGSGLGSENTYRGQVQSKISFTDAQFITLRLLYGGVTVTSCVVKNVSGSSKFDVPLLIEALLSADGSSTAQIGHIRSAVGLPPSEDGSTPVGFGQSGVNSAGDNAFQIWGQWSANNTNCSITNQHVTLERISFIPDPVAGDLNEPTLLILIGSKFNNLSYVAYSLRRSITFYAPVEHDLVFFGYGSATFTRGSASSATWRDGASHTVQANLPRFEYSGNTYLGMRINTGTETLTYDPANVLDNGNTLVWLEDNVVQSTLTVSNPFNSNGTYIGNSNVHVRQIVKFNRVLSASEVGVVGQLISA